MKSHELKRRFFEFFQKREHKLIPPAPFLSSNPKHPFTASGLEPLQKYYLGEADPMNNPEARLNNQPISSLSAVAGQYCFRPEDAELVGDNSHLTFFEMLGAYTFGGYKKHTAIKVTNDFFKNLNLFTDYVTVFGGDAGFPNDKDTEYMWKELGVTYIQRLGLKENFWGPVGNGGVCGPTSEIYMKDMGVWSIIFLTHSFPGTHKELISENNTRKLKRLGIGGIASITGLERLTAVANGKTDVFATDIFEPLFLPLRDTDIAEKQKRIIADHLRTFCFLTNEGLVSGRKDFLAKSPVNLIRRLFIYERLLKISDALFKEIVEKIITQYSSDFKNPAETAGNINGIIFKERAGFAEKMEKGLKKLLKLGANNAPIDAQTAFHLFEKFGLPFESIKEFGGAGAKNLAQEDFKIELEKHLPASERKQQEKGGIGSKLKELWSRIP